MGKNRGHTAIQLSNLTHKQGTPWHTMVEKFNGRVPRETEITEQLMAKFYNVQSRD